MRGYANWDDAELVKAAKVLEEDLLRFEREAEATNEVYKVVREELKKRKIVYDSIEGFDH